MFIDKYQIVVIGCSAGGFKALHALLPLFNKDFQLPIVVIQHRKPVKDSYLAESWARSCVLPLKEAENGMNLVSGEVLIAPPALHLQFSTDKTIHLSSEKPVNFSRPSIDVAMNSAAVVFKTSAIGILLTGANNDGAGGMLNIKNAGGLTIAQNPEEAEMPVMPKSAINNGAVDFILPLVKIPEFIVNLVLESRLYSSFDFE